MEADAGRERIADVGDVPPPARLDVARTELERGRQMLNWITGKKTYIVAVAVFVLGGLQASGIAIPEYVYVLLGALGITTLRAAVKKTESYLP